jgi:hypothetical protein
MQSHMPWVGVVGVVLSIAWPAGAVSLFVNNASTAPAEDGTAAAPYRTITRALERARAIRLALDAPPGAIVVHVAPSATPYAGSFDPQLTDPSKERLPLVLNVPKLKLIGGTVLAMGADGLPSGVAPGTGTTLRSDLPQGARQYLILIARTTMAGVEMDGNEVTVEGMLLEAAPTRQIFSTLIGIDGVRDFVVTGNALVNGSNAVFTRLASGRIESNFVSGAITTGLYLTGGSQTFPSRLVVTGNRVESSGPIGMTGIAMLGAAETTSVRSGLDLGANQPTLTYVAPPEEFDRALAPALVPDTIHVEAVGNSVGGFLLGIRCTGYLQNPYRLVAGQEESAHVTAVLRQNTATAIANYGLCVDAAQIALGDRRSIDLTLAVEGNTFQGGTANAVLSFWRFAGSFEIAMGSTIPFTFTGNIFGQPNPTFARHSTIAVCGDLTQFKWDNRQDPDPPTNPPPLDNQMTVNGVALDGRWPNNAAEVGTPMPVAIPPAPTECVAPLSAP